MYLEGNNDTSTTSGSSEKHETNSSSKYFKLPCKENKQLTTFNKAKSYLLIFLSLCIADLANLIYINFVLLYIVLL